LQQWLRNDSNWERLSYEEKILSVLKLWFNKACYFFAIKATHQLLPQPSTYSKISNDHKKKRENSPFGEYSQMVFYRKPLYQAELQKREKATKTLGNPDLIRRLSSNIWGLY